MIRLTRVRTASAIPAGFRGQKRIERLQELIAFSAAGTFSFKTTVWKAAKNQLKRETHGKCAYCEAPTSAVAHGDVEHFRPKSVYWWLAYCYENYTYSCQICNQTYKSDSFPIAGSAMVHGDLAQVAFLTPDPFEEATGMRYADFQAACAAEGSHLPDVYFDDVESLLGWEADAVKKQVLVVARPGSAASARAVAAVDQFLGLNRPELKGLRWAVYLDLETFRDTLAVLPAGHPTAVKVANRIKAMMADSGEFAGMVRYFVREQWQLVL